jgi:hypothetical protein
MEVDEGLLLRDFSGETATARRRVALRVTGGGGLPGFEVALVDVNQTPVREPAIRM